MVQVMGIMRSYTLMKWIFLIAAVSFWMEKLFPKHSQLSTHKKKKKTVHILNDTKTVLILTYFRWIEKVIKLEVMEFILTGQEILIETPIFTSKRRELN